MLLQVAGSRILLVVATLLQRCACCCLQVLADAAKGLWRRYSAKAKELQQSVHTVGGLQILYYGVAAKCHCPVPCCRPGGLKTQQDACNKCTNSLKAVMNLPQWA